MSVAPSTGAFRRWIGRFLRMAQGERPPEWTKDEWNRWQAARQVSDGTGTQLFVTAQLARSRQSHALFEGYADPEEVL